MKEVWRYVKDSNRQYKVSNYGRVINSKTNHELKQWSQTRSGRLYVGLSKKGKSWNLPVTTLVHNHFHKTSPFLSVGVNKDCNPVNNISQNVDGGTRGDLIRRNYTAKNKKRGAYPWKDPSNPNRKWRAMIKYEGKLITLGYFETKEDAYDCYQESFASMHGFWPWI